MQCLNRNVLWCIYENLINGYGIYDSNDWACKNQPCENNINHIASVIMYVIIAVRLIPNRMIINQ